MQNGPISSQTVIDWVDFVIWDGVEYNRIYSGAISDESYIGENMGTVQYKVADVVRNPNYKTKDGDAAFHEIGTEIYEVKGDSELLAIKDSDIINGYSLYYPLEDDKYEYGWNFEDIPLERVKKIEIYDVANPEDPTLTSVLEEQEELDGLIAILNISDKEQGYEPESTDRDPSVYELVFYTDDPVAFLQMIQHDGKHYFWYPWDVALLPDEVESYIKKDESAD
ncbi:hypothetical protein AB685_04295 [Bacillus sp. LL01]|nr:hypothetical protein AB685_04295 [Bacillus sp. LL01]